MIAQRCSVMILHVGSLNWSYEVMELNITVCIGCRAVQTQHKQYLYSNYINFGAGNNT